MKNISLRFTLVAIALVLVGGMVRGSGTPVGIAIFLSPLAMVTMLLSIKLHQTIAHVLNMVPTIIWLALPVVYLIGKDAGDLAFIILVFVFGPVLLASIVMLWLMAWALRGEEEINEEDFKIRGRLSQLVLPQPSEEARLQMQKLSIPPSHECPKVHDRKCDEAVKSSAGEG
jgi:hypothetical protein